VSLSLPFDSYLMAFKLQLKCREMVSIGADRALWNRCDLEYGDRISRVERLTTPMQRSFTGAGILEQNKKERSRN